MGNERTYTAEEPGARTAENLSKATMELKSTCAKRNKDQAGPILDHIPSLGSETNVQMREAGESTTAEADAEEEENGRGRPSNTGTTGMHAGIVDPTSTMMWSPGKRAGQKRSLQAREEAEAKSVTESGDTDEESKGESGESRQEEEEAMEEEANMDTVRLATNINTYVTRAEKELEESRVAEAPATQIAIQGGEGCRSLDIQAEADYGQRGKAERERERQESLSEELRREKGGVESAERESETLGEANARPEDEGAGESVEGSFLGTFHRRG